MVSQTEEEPERKMLERVGILPKKPPFLRGEDARARAIWEYLVLDLFSSFGMVSAVEEKPLVKRIEHLEKTVQDLKKEKGIKKAYSKADLIYYKFKDQLEKENFGKIVAIDVDSKKIVGIGSSILEAYSQARKNSSKKQFSYRRVGFDFVHRM